MKKLIIAVLFSMLFSLGTQAQTDIELHQCSTYYDGCNTCSVIDGKIGGCTEMACFQKGTPKCLVPIADTIETVQQLCEQNTGEYDSGSDICTINDNTVSGKNLFGAYREVSEDMMYLGGSKYFNEMTGSYDRELQQADYEGLLFIKQNIPTTYTLHEKEIDVKISSLENALGHNKDSSPDDRYEQALGKSIMGRLNIIANKLVSKTNHMSIIEKEKFLINKVKLLEKLRTRYVNKNFTGKYKKTIILLEYLNMKIERHISYE